MNNKKKLDFKAIGYRLGYMFGCLCILCMMAIVTALTLKGIVWMLF